jgi:hypothetical protein
MNALSRIRLGTVTLNQADMLKDRHKLSVNPSFASAFSSNRKGDHQGKKQKAELLNGGHLVFRCESRRDEVGIDYLNSG